MALPQQHVDQVQRMIAEAVKDVHNTFGSFSQEILQKSNELQKEMQDFRLAAPALIQKTE